MGEEEATYARRGLSLDKWRAGKQINDRSKTWGAQEAVNFQAMLRKLAAEVETAEIMTR